MITLLHDLIYRNAKHMVIEYILSDTGYRTYMYMYINICV